MATSSLSKDSRPKAVIEAMMPAQQFHRQHDETERAEADEEGRQQFGKDIAIENFSHGHSTIHDHEPGKIYGISKDL
jgi:hypothetical protein